MGVVAINGALDDLRSADVRFIEEAAKLGPVHVHLWTDEVVRTITGKPPKFPLAERRYFVEALRFVHRVSPLDRPGDTDRLPTDETPSIWAVTDSQNTPARRNFATTSGIDYRVISNGDLSGFPIKSPPSQSTNGRKRVIVTGCYDWLHTGHVRFFEEVSEYGDLYTVLGNDANIEFLKGSGHPQFRHDERRYMVNSLRFVTQALIASGNGWLDAEPEIRQIKPHIYAVNEDGDKPEKKSYCQANGIEYVVLKRLPKQGLPRRQSTDLRGF